MQHPAQINDTVRLSIDQNTSIELDVVGYELNDVDKAYHYHLQGTLSDGNNAATVQFGDVHQSLIILKED
jgi:hypothetical protein